MKIPLRYGIFIALLFFCVCVAYGLHAYLFFAGELRNQGITESVRIGVHAYSVEKGVVLLEHVPVIGIDTLKALRIAYAKALAERSPLLGLEGTDPEALRANTKLLEETMAKISQIQGKSEYLQLMNAVLYPDGISQFQIEAEDSELVKTALYPTDFLYALAALEKARKQFIASGSQSDMDVYGGSFDAVFKFGIHDSKKLVDALVYKTRSSNSIRLPGFAGTITAASSVDSLRSIPESFSVLKQRAAERAWCMAGITWFCPPLTTPTLPAVLADQSEKTDLDSQGTMRTEIASILRSVAATSTYDGLFAPVRLNKSACLASLPSPYELESAVSWRLNFDLLHYMNDMYFIPTAGSSGPVPQFLRNTYGLNYLKINPLVFYLCPYLLEDVSDAHAILKTAALAKKYPDIPNSHRDILISGIPTESDAIAYLREAGSILSRESVPTLYAQEVLSLSLIFNQKSAGLDAVVGQIVYINEHDLVLAQEGTPFDVSAQSLLLTHTAAPSLFLFHQIGALSPVVPSTRTDKKDFYKHFRPLSDLLLNISGSVIINEIRSLNRIEKKEL